MSAGAEFEPRRRALFFVRRPDLQLSWMQKKMTTEYLRKNLATLMEWEPEIVGDRELVVTPACHGYGPSDATEVVVGLRGSPPRYRLVVSNMHYDWSQRVLLHNEKRIPNGARKQMACALTDRHLVATGYGVNNITPYPPMHLLPRGGQGLQLPDDFG